MKRKLWKKAKRSKSGRAARDLIGMAGDGVIDFEEVARPTRFKKYRIDY